MVIIFFLLDSFLIQLLQKQTNKQKQPIRSSSKEAMVPPYRRQSPSSHFTEEAEEEAEEQVVAPTSLYPKQDLLQQDDIDDVNFLPHDAKHLGYGNGSGIPVVGHHRPSSPPKVPQRRNSGSSRRSEAMPGFADQGGYHNHHDNHQYQVYQEQPNRVGAFSVRNQVAPSAPSGGISVASQISGISYGSYRPPVATGGPTMIELSPGVTIPLREIEETLDAVANDHYVPVCCIGCSADIFCIADASYALCPDCHSFTPLEGGSVSTRDRHGLGLGFTVENLFRMQAEILESRGVSNGPVSTSSPPTPV